MPLEFPIATLPYLGIHPTDYLAYFETMCTSVHAKHAAMKSNPGQPIQAQNLKAVVFTVGNGNRKKSSKFCLF